MMTHHSSARSWSEIKLSRALTFPKNVFWRWNHHTHSTSPEVVKKSNRLHWKSVGVIAAVICVLASVAIVLSVIVGKPSQKPKIVIKEGDASKVDKPFSLPPPPSFPDQMYPKKTNEVSSGSLFNSDPVSEDTSILWRRFDLDKLTVDSNFYIKIVSSQDLHFTRNRHRHSGVVIFDTMEDNYTLCIDEIPTFKYADISRVLCSVLLPGTTIADLYSQPKLTSDNAGNKVFKCSSSATTPTECTADMCRSCQCTGVIAVDCFAESFHGRLIAGPHKNEGFVQVFFNNSWGYVCSDTDDPPVAPDALCDALGITPSGRRAYAQVERSCGFNPPDMMTHRLKYDCSPGGDSFITNCAPVIIQDATECEGRYIRLHCKAGTTYVAPISDPGCDFEDGTICSFTLGGDIQWRMFYAADTTVQTGPQKGLAHHYNNRYYLYVDATSPWYETSAAMLYSRTMDFNSGSEIRFMYNLFGDSNGTLNVYQETGGAMNLLSSLSQPGENQWKSARISLSAGTNSRIIFQGVRGNSIRSNIAIDNIEISFTALSSDCALGYTALGASCVFDDLVCNGFVEYLDGVQTDESGCSCGMGEFQCADGTCIPGNYVCDGRISCPSGNDESGCGCDSSQFQCDNNACLNPDQLCNGVNECGDGSDERSCDCSDGFLCSDSICVPAESQCDWTEQCSDGGDDADCALQSLEVDTATFATNTALRASMPGTYGFLASPVFPVNSVSCLRFRYQGFVNFAPALYLEITINDIEKRTSLPVMTPINGVWKQAQVRIEVGYTTAKIRVKFALQATYIDDIHVDDGECLVTPSQPAINSHAQGLATNNIMDINTMCDFSNGVCDLQLQGFLWINNNVGDRLRLTGDPGIYGQLSGQLEFQVGNAWGALCNTGWSDARASIVCNMFGYKSGVMTENIYNPSLDQVWADQLYCPPDMKSLFECHHGGYGGHNCEESNAVAIQCTEPYYSTLGASWSEQYSHISTDGSAISLLYSAAHPTAQCLQFSYRSLTGHWIYAGGLSEDAFTPHTVAMFNNPGGTVFLENTGSEEWITVETQLTATDVFFIMAMADDQYGIQIKDIILLSASCSNPKVCPEDDLICSTALQCYTVFQRCDGRMDCLDGSDEASCTPDICDDVWPPMSGDYRPCSERTVGGTDHNANCNSACMPSPDPNGGGDPWCTTNNGWGICVGDAVRTQDGNTGGAICHFPFIYEGVSYSSCVRRPEDFIGAWCSTTDNYDLDGRWGYCSGCPDVGCLEGTFQGTGGNGDCVFPFEYGGMTFYSCTTLDHNKRWCLTTNGGWGNCRGCADEETCRGRVDTYGGNMFGDPCVFPYVYRGTVYEWCTTRDFGLIHWCSGTANYDRTPLWGICDGCTAVGFSKCYYTTWGGTGNGALCTIPYTYDGYLFNDKTSYRHVRPWCATSRDYDLLGAWGNVAECVNTPFMRQPLCLGNAISFEDETLGGGTQDNAACSLLWEVRNENTPTLGTGARFSADRLPMAPLQYLGWNDMFNREIVNFFAKDVEGNGYMQVNMTNNETSSGDCASITYPIDVTMTCLRFCYHMVGRQVGSLSVIADGALVLYVSGSQEVDKYGFLGYKPFTEWNCIQIRNGGIYVASVEFLATKSEGDEGDISVDRIHFLENCENNEFYCPAGMFSCGDGQCIHESMVCDFQRNCGYGLDENNCAYDSCPDGHFRCNFGRCLNATKVCDGYSDCDNGEDEDDCDSMTPVMIMEDPEMTWRCDSGEMIFISQRCDHQTDCVDESDEQNCVCDDKDLACGGFCIPPKDHCDSKKRHCPDGSDEGWFCPGCPLDKFQCDDGPCLEMSQKCDGVNDCEDGSDESITMCTVTCPVNIDDIPDFIVNELLMMPPATIEYGERYKLDCNGTWYIPSTVTYTEFTLECCDGVATVRGPYGADVICQNSAPSPTPSRFLPCCLEHSTAPWSCSDARFNPTTGFASVGLTNAPGGGLLFKGRRLNTLYVGNNGVVHTRNSKPGSPTPICYDFLAIANLDFMDIFALLAIDLVDDALCSIYFDEYVAGDIFLDALTAEACKAHRVLHRTSSCSFSTTYAVAISFVGAMDTNGVRHSAQLAIIMDDSIDSSFAIMTFGDHPGVPPSSPCQVGGLTLTADILRPDLLSGGDLVSGSNYGEAARYAMDVGPYKTQITFLPGHNMIPYGTPEGDTKIALLREDPTTPLTETTFYILQLSANFPAFGTSYQHLGIFNNGFLTLGNNQYSGGYSNFFCLSPFANPEQTPHIVYLNADLAPNYSPGAAYIRDTSNSTVIQILYDEVCSVNDCTGWNPNRAVVFTYHGIVYDVGVSLENHANTFQVGLVTDGTTSFVVVIYGILTSYDELNCLTWRGVRNDFSDIRFLDVNTDIDIVTFETVHSSQFRTNAVTPGRWVLSLNDNMQ